MSILTEIKSQLNFQEAGQRLKNIEKIKSDTHKLNLCVFLSHENKIKYYH